MLWRNEYMPEMNFELLQENIRILIKKNGITQNDLASIAGMTQANVSKRLLKSLTITQK